eukprot:NODE_81_length_22758_cov_0.877797.p9 type:complete len:257 gc:universal NODE_81_length_22758_cov_0.877797:3572-4342(+)
MYFRELMKNLQQEHIAYAMSMLCEKVSYDEFVKVLGSRYILDFKSVDFFQLKQENLTGQEYADKIQKFGKVAKISEVNLNDHSKASLKDDIAIVLISIQFESWSIARKAALDVEKRLNQKVSESKSDSNGFSGFCHFCKQPGHISKTCIVRLATICNKCKGEGHLEKDCKRDDRDSKREVNNVVNDEVKISDIYYKLRINGHLTTSLLDTGVNCSILIENTYGYLGLKMSEYHGKVSCGGVEKRILGFVEYGNGFI